LDEGAKNEVFEGLSAKQIQEIADICNAYPNIETKFQVSYDEEQQDEDAGDEEENEIPFTLDIELSKDVEEEDEIEEWVTFKHYQPDSPKQISRWLVVGSMQTKELLSIKRFSFNAKNSRIETVQDEDGEEETKCVYRTKLSWSLNKEIFEQVKKGEDKLKLYLMSDSWVGCDQEYDIEL
jgi:pre-mRNA-splicing helicase BRR2